jgi:hypothetical protein
VGVGIGIPCGMRSAGFGPGVGVGGKFREFGSRSFGKGGGVAFGTLFGLGIKSLGIFGEGVGDGEPEGDAEGEGEADDNGDGLA